MIFGDRMTPRYILRDHPARALVEEYARERGWPLVSEAPGDPDRVIGSHVIWLTPTTITLDYEEDYVARLSYVYFRGDDFTSLPGMVADLKNALRPWERDEFLQAVSAARTGQERALAVLHAGFGAPLEFDQEFFDAISSCMAADETPLRDAAVLAAGAAAWPQFRPVLEQVAANDPEAEVREMAKAALRAYDKFGIGEQ